LILFRLIISLLDNTERNHRPRVRRSEGTHKGHAKLTLHCVQIVRLLFSHEVDLADVSLAEQFDLLEGGWGDLDLCEEEQKKTPVSGRGEKGVDRTRAANAPTLS
jgi:hypothetical protein